MNDDVIAWLEWPLVVIFFAATGWGFHKYGRGWALSGFMASNGALIPLYLIGCWIQAGYQA